MPGSGQLERSSERKLRWRQPSEWYLEAEGTDLRVVKAYIKKGIPKYSLMRTLPITEPFERWHIGVFDTSKEAIRAAETYYTQHPECRKPAK